MEINLLLRINNLEELQQFIDMMKLFPAAGKAINFEKANEDLQKKAEALRQEVAELEAKKQVLSSSLSASITVAVNP